MRLTGLNTIPLALNMRTALPNATFPEFTGTPLIATEDRTREVFGDYISIYDFQQSGEDGATVALFYENRTPELRLKNPVFLSDGKSRDRPRCILPSLWLQEG